MAMTSDTPILRFEHRAILGGVGEERNRHDIGFGAGALGEAMDHVEGACRKAARQAAQQGDEARLAGIDARHEVDRSGEGAAMANADEIVSLAFDQIAQIARPGRAKRAQRQRHHRRYWAQPRNAEAHRRDFSCSSSSMQPAIGPSTKTRINALVARPRDETMRLGALDAEQLRHFALRLAAGEMQPRGARSERGFLVQLQARAGGGSTLPISFEFFFLS